MRKLILLLAFLLLLLLPLALVYGDQAVKNLTVTGTLTVTDVTNKAAVLTALGALDATGSTSYGRSLLTVADAAALRTLAGLVIGTNVLAPSGNGSALTSLTAANITAAGTLPALNGSALTSLNATNLSSGTVAAARGGAGTTSGIMKANGSGTVSAASAGTDYLAPAGNGSSLTSLNGSAIASGTVPAANLPANLTALANNSSTALTLGNIAPTFGAVAASTLAVGGGTVITKIYANIGTLDFPSTASLGTSDLGINVTGAVLSDAVVLGVPNGSVIAGTSYFAWVSSAGTVTVRFTNPTLTSQDPASGTFSVVVFHF